MRSIRIAAAVAALVMPVSAANAEPACCDPDLPTVIYGSPPVPYVPPPSGYLLDPSDSRAPIYVVNQGPAFYGPGIYAYPGFYDDYNYAVPTYSEGGYAYADPYPTPYPYVQGRFGIGTWRDAAPVIGRGAGYPGVRDITVIAGSGRPYGPHPRHAYRYRTGASAKVMRVPPRAN